MTGLHFATLGDARRNRLELKAICRNIECRHEGMVDLIDVISHVGTEHTLLPVAGVKHFSDRLRCRVCGSKGMFIWPGEAKRFVPIWEEQLSFSVEQWDPAARHIQSLLARLNHLNVARAAYETAVKIYPTQRIMLRQGGFVLEDSKLRVVRGGKS